LGLFFSYFEFQLQLQLTARTTCSKTGRISTHLKFWIFLGCHRMCSFTPNFILIGASRRNCGDRKPQIWRTRWM